MVELEEDPVDAVYAMIQFLYSRVYDVPGDLDLDRQAALHAEVYALAHKYDIPSLVEYTEKLFLDMSKPTNDRKGHLACIRAANIVYKKTPETDRGLRDILLWLTYYGHGAIFQMNPDEKAIFDECPEFAIDYAKQKTAGKPEYGL